MTNNLTPQPAEGGAPWRDTGGHAWERHAAVESVECPHCCFIFAAVHTDGNSDGYSCPNCEGCPDTRATQPATAPGGRAIAHRCSKGQLRPYPSLVCSMCRESDGTDLSAHEVVAIVNTTPTDIAERARRIVEMFNEWLVTDFEPTLTADQEEALRRIVAAEFGGEGR